MLSGLRFMVKPKKRAASVRAAWLQLLTWQSRHAAYMLPLLKAAVALGTFALAAFSEGLVM